nr:serologically defined colon cancer antigen 3 isoform X2 [Pogona vitticeps]
MAGRGAFAAGPPSSPAEEANPFSFKEFVRSKSQNAPPAAVPRAKGGRGASPQEPGRSSQLLEDDSFSPDSLTLSLGLREPFFPDPTVTDSFLDDDEDEEEDWSRTYKPSAVEDTHHASRAPGTSRSSCFDSYYGDLSTFSPWQPAGKRGPPRDPRRDGDDSSPADGAALGEGFYPPLLPSYEELKQENSRLRSKIGHVQAVSEAQTERARIKELERTLEESKRKEEKEARDLEAMVQQVEENLQLMTKRAVKAESNAVRLKQENALLQVQVENYRREGEALKRGHVANLAVVKQNTDVALQNLLAVITKSKVSIKQLISGAEELQLVVDLLKSLDKISELPQDSP